MYLEPSSSSKSWFELSDFGAALQSCFRCHSIPSGEGGVERSLIVAPSRRARATIRRSARYRRSSQSSGRISLAHLELRYLPVAKPRRAKSHSDDRRTGEVLPLIHNPMTDAVEKLQPQLNDRSGPVEDNLLNLHDACAKRTVFRMPASNFLVVSLVGRYGCIMAC